MPQGKKINLLKVALAAALPTAMLAYDQLDKGYLI